MRKLMGLTMVVMSMLLAGCAGTSENGFAGSRGAGLHVVDQDYVQRVAAASRYRNVDVQWVNPPQVRKPLDKQPNGGT